MDRYEEAVVRIEKGRSEDAENKEATPPTKPYGLFISYAHEKEAVKDRLRIHLAPLIRTGWVELWDDREIPAGGDWRAEIGKAMAQADGAIFLLDENFLASDFCMDEEVPTFLGSHRTDGKLIIFVVTDHCGWDEFAYIKQHKVIPLDGRPITSYNPHSRAYTHIKDEIKGALARHACEASGASIKVSGRMGRILVSPGKHKVGRPQLPDSPISFKTRDSHAFRLDDGDAPLFSRERVSTIEKIVSNAQTGSLQVLLAKLPGATTHLFGREVELAQIDAWKDKKGIFLWIAEGGTGKSALVRWWLARQEWPEGTRFIGHSFYSQGSKNQATSARGFLLDALRQLAVWHELNASDDELGRLMAEEAAKAPTVLVLDGMEPLQQVSLDEKLNGMVKDRGLATLLERLAKNPGQALCLAGSRLPIPDVGIADGIYFEEMRLGVLPPEGAQALLRQRGMRGTEAEIAAMAERCGHHPLALILAAEFCHTFLEDGAQAFLEHDWQPEPGAAHAATVMRWFDETLKEEHQTLDRELAHILGLFDRPAPWGALMALKEAAPIAGLTEALHEADKETLLESLARLAQWGLLDADLSRKEPDLDAHPLVREHFGAELEANRPEAWRAAHSALFDWFCALPEKDLPDTVEEMEPLYRAVGHGCEAGRFRTALYEVYQRRIRHGKQGYSLFQLGAVSSDLAALAGFFPYGWDAPPVAADGAQAGEGLSEAARSWLMADAAYCLMSLGRLEEALAPRLIGWQRLRDVADWTNFCVASNSLADIYTLMGNWRGAEDVLREAVQAATRIEEEGQQWNITASGARLGRILHGQGRFAESRAAFAEAEAVQGRSLPQAPKLYSMGGYDYAEFLLEQSGQVAGWREVLARGDALFQASSQSGNLLFQGLGQRARGFALAALGEQGAVESFDRAVNIIRRASAVYIHPLAHLARAVHHRTQQDFKLAWNDHAAALAIARRGNMRTYLAECALLAANLCLDQGRVVEVLPEYVTARHLIHGDGYLRRLAELLLLQARICHAKRDVGAEEALHEAEARIRETGQWYFWRELRTVANEIGAPDPGECPDSGDIRNLSHAQEKGNP